MSQQPASLDDLTPAPYNPRMISPDALAGLASSVEKFGDLSGLVWNARTGHLVAGHQRLKALTARGATFQASPPALVLGREVFPIRVVNWDDQTEKAANITANNPKIAGEFTDNLQGLLGELSTMSGFDDLRLDALMDAPPPPMTDTPDDSGDGSGSSPGAGDGPDAHCTIGAYRFVIGRGKYFEWLEAIRQEVGFDEEAIIAELRRRLGLDECGAGGRE